MLAENVHIKLEDAPDEPRYYFYRCFLTTGIDSFVLNVPSQKSKVAFLMW